MQNERWETQAQPTEPLVLICNYEKLIKIIIKSFMEQNKRNAKKASMKIWSYFMVNDTTCTWWSAQCNSKFSIKGNTWLKIQKLWSDKKTYFFADLYNQNSSVW
jgi:hypothetical protein